MILPMRRQGNNGCLAGSIRLRLAPARKERELSTVAVRIPREAHAEIRRIAERRHQTVGRVVSDMVADHKRKEFWEEYQRAAVEARNDPAVWKQMQDEQSEFDGALLDGIG